VAFNEFKDRWASLHGDIPMHGFILGWLRISYALTRPLALLKTSPHILTVAGVIFSIATWKSSHLWIAPFYLVASLLLDGLDGSLALLRSKESKWGAILDAFADRVAEIFWVLTFFQLGAPKVLVAFAWIAASTQEYVRARMGGLGAVQIEVITIAERPVRATLLFIALISSHTHFHCVTALAWMWAIMQIASFFMVFSDGYRRLK
jgi:phosphatidylglycerophosphate synthase